MHTTPFHISEQYRAKTFLVLGGTGFLGKVFWCLLLHRFPEIGRIVLVVRSQKGRSSEQRFWSEVATSDALRPLRDRHGDQFESFLRDKILVTDGDVGAPLCGIPEATLNTLRGNVDAVVNVAGVVDFNPPLDEALHANAFGAKNLIALCKHLGDAALFHTSTCYVVGERPGLVKEALPGTIPFPLAGDIDARAWNPEREVEDGLDIVREVQARAKDGFRQSEFVHSARKQLERRGEPTGPQDVADVAREEERQWVRTQLRIEGESRAKHWGWPNTYTYTKSIGEQLIASSGLRFTIARPACCESTLRFPFAGWNEGLGTSAPIIYAVLKGQHQLVARDVSLDFVPADLVCVGMALALGELLENTHRPVYHFGAADVNPATSDRFAELIGIYKRKSYAKRAAAKKAPWTARIGQHFETAGVSTQRFERFGPPAVARALQSAARVLDAAPKQLLPWTERASSNAKALARREERLAEVLRLFTPFTYAQKGPFDCENTRAAYTRLPAEERHDLLWDPEQIDWADYWTRIHMPCMEHKIVPWMDARFAKKARALRRHASLLEAWSQAVQRAPHAPALGTMVGDEIAWATYGELESDGFMQALIAQLSPELAEELCASLASLGAKYTLSEHDTCVTLGPKARGLGLSAGTLLPLLRGARVLHLNAKDPRMVARILGRVRATMVVAPPSFWNAYAKHLKSRLPKGVPGAELLARADAFGLGRPKYLLCNDEGLEPKARATLARMGLRLHRFHSYDQDTLPLAVNGRPLPGVEWRLDASTNAPAGYGELYVKTASGVWRSTGDHAQSDSKGRLVVIGRAAHVLRTRAGSVVQPELLERRLHGLKVLREWALVQITLPDDEARVGLLAVRNTSVAAGDAGYLRAERELREAIACWPPEEQPSVVRLVDSRLKRLDASGEIDRASASRVLLDMMERGTDSIPRSVPPRAPNRYAVGPSSERRSEVPAPISRLTTQVFSSVEERLVDRVIRPRVVGRKHIPHNRSVLVVANHASHLDAPLLRYALGDYGARMLVTAAADYFLEGSAAKKSLFSALSYVAPIARTQGAKESLADLLEAWGRGSPMLVFPEGTRSTSGQMSEFRPLIGQLIQRAGMSVLPVHIEGSHALMPKGSKFPNLNAAQVVVRIGRPLSPEALLGATTHTGAAGARLLAQRLQEAVRALAQGQVITSFQSGTAVGAQHESLQEERP